MPEGYAIQAIQAVLSGQRAYCKFLAANDTGLTGGHQAGIYISKPSIPILFDEPGIKGTNKEKWVKVKWQDGIETDTRFIYYGKGTRNEYRITNFGRGFPFLRPEYTGALFVFTKCDAEDYQALARDFAVSREVILHRLWDIDFIGKSDYFDILNRYTDEYRAYKQKKKTDGFLPPALDKGTQVGKLYTKAVMSAYHAEKLTPREASNYLLGLRVKHFEAVERWCY